MDLSKLSDADLQYLVDGDVTKLSDEGLGILAGVQPKQKPDDITNGLKTVGKRALGSFAGDAAAIGDLIAGIPKMATQGAMQLGGMLSGQSADLAEKASQHAVEETFPSFSSLLEKLPEGYREGAQGANTVLMAPIQGFTDLLSLPGKGVEAVTGNKDLAAGTNLAANTAALLAPFAKAKSRVQVKPTEGTKILRDPNESLTTREGSPFNRVDVPKNFKPTVPISPEAQKILDERERAKQTPQQETPQPQPTVQTELDLGQPNQFGHRPSEFTIDENGIPIRRDASLEAQETTRGGDLFSMENQANELKNDVLNKAEPQFEEGFPANRDYLKQQEVEQAYLDKAKQDTLPLEEPITEPTQRSAGMTGFGKGQRGAINPEVFKEGFEKIKDSVTKGLEGVKLIARGEDGNKLHINAVDSEGKHIGGAIFRNRDGYLTSDVTVVSPGMRGKRVSDALYKYASELDNDVRPSFDQTDAGRSMWDRFEREGLTSETKLGQTYIAKGQRGSIGFGPEKYDQFANRLRKEIPDISNEELKSAWEAKQSQAQVSTATKVAGGISPKLQKELSAYNDVTEADALSAIKSSSDNADTSMGFIKNNLLARGRLGFEKIQNEGLKAGLAYMVGLRDKARISANTILHGNDGLMTGFRKIEKWFSPGEAAEVIKQRLEAQFNPDYQFDLNPRQMKLQEQMTKMFDDYKARFEQVLGKPLHTVANYFPSLFYGDFATKILDADGRLVAWVTENSAKELKDATAHVLGDLGEGYSASEPIYRKDIKKTGFQGKTGLAEYFDSMLELLSSDDPVVQKAQQSVQNVVNKRAFQTRQTQNRFKFKSGVMGAEGNKTWKTDRENYYAAKQVIENYVRGAEDWLANMESAKFLDTVKEQAPDSKNTYNVLQGYFDDIRGTGVKSDGILQELDNALANSTIKGGVTGTIAGISRDLFGTQATRKVANMLVKNWLGLWNPTAMAQNMLQPIRTVSKLTDLAAQGGSKDVVSPMILGMMDSLVDGLAYASNKTLKTNLPENVKFQLANEVIKPSLVESEGKTAAGHYGEKILVSGGMLSTEAFARSTTYNIFKRYLENSGYDAKQAMDLSKNLTHDYQVNYENYARAGLINKTGPLGEMAGRLQSFKVNELTQLANYIETLKQTKNPIPLATALSVSIAMAGVSGMIGMDVAEGIYGLLVKSGLVDPRTQSPRQWALSLGGSLAHGVPTEASGQWLSGSLTTNIIGDSSWRSVAPVFAGIVDVGSKLPIGAKWAMNHKAVPDSEKAQFMEAVSPTVLRGMIEKKYLTDKEGRVSSQYTGKPVYKNSPEESNSLASYTNLRPTERGAIQATAATANTQEKMIAEKQNAKIKNLQKLFDEDIRSSKGVDEQVVVDHINDIVDLGGDPQVVVKKIVDFVVNNHLDNWFEQQVGTGKINLGNAQKKMRAIDNAERFRK